MQKTILITGTSNGFGKDAALTLAAAGHRVFATMRDSLGRNREAAAALQAKGIEVVELDVKQNASVDAAFAAVFEKTGGRLDVLINNAGLMIQGISETITAEQTRDMFDVNVFGIQRTTRAALPAMRRAKTGLIVNIGSILGRVTIPFVGLYGATKHAVEAMTESYRYELSQLGVDVVLVQPSAYPTNLYSTHQDPADAAREPEYGEVAAVPKGFVAFLQSVFSGADAPDPHDVAQALVTLVETPAGQRPERVVVGNPFGATDVNAVVKPIQGQLIEGIGMSGLAALKV
ncbi:SDR family oxidoreductase [Paucibacter sp. R3-3]|uniref:SDR family oxidoreductase n=1 Tax=Roseateles agri TaxID=3098619 RepID=A0ABU5DJX6_9BURK|nr:SDR family oxidoreductase [Paucibacter sp. R3-3]MDY0746597.1 SDR family oxidoreductase [Paucibacter sp. R3-3]